MAGINPLATTTYNQGSSDDVVDTNVNLLENFVCGHDYEAEMGKHHEYGCSPLIDCGFHRQWCELRMKFHLHN